METMRSSQAVNDVYGASAIDNILCQEKKRLNGQFWGNLRFFKGKLKISIVAETLQLGWFGRDPGAGPMC